MEIKDWAMARYMRMCQLYDEMGSLSREIEKRRCEMESMFISDKEQNEELAKAVESASHADAHNA